MTRVVLDAGALIALEKNDREMWGVIKLAALRTTDVIVPSTVVAQVWRKTPGQALLAKALRHSVIASFDTVARAVGELCGRAQTTDICDAHVAIVATSAGDALYTSDPKDMHRLIRVIGRRRPTVVRC